MKHLTFIGFIFCILLFYFTDPACQDINTHDQCYVSDPSCPTRNVTKQLSNHAISTDMYTPTYTEEINNSTVPIYVSTTQAPTDMNIVWGIYFVSAMIIVLAVLILGIKRYRQQRKVTKKDPGKIDDCVTMFRLSSLFCSSQYQYSICRVSFIQTGVLMGRQLSSSRFLCLQKVQHMSFNKFFITNWLISYMDHRLLYQLIIHSKVTVIKDGNERTRLGIWK